MIRHNICCYYYILPTIKYYMYNINIMKYYFPIKWRVVCDNKGGLEAIN